MRSLRTAAVVAILLIGPLLTGDRAAAASGWIPSADYCGWVWRDPSRTNHNGIDIWTTDPNPFAGGMGFAGTPKGFPVQLAASGILRQKYSLSGVVYGLRFYHSALDQTTFYWHMAPSNASTSYVESTLVVGNTYPAGTFLGYQGNLSPDGSTIVHLHNTLANDEPTSDNGYPVGVTDPNGNPGIGLDPSTFYGRNLNGQAGGACYGSQNMQYPGAAPMPSSPHPYPNNTVRWYVVVNAQTTASVTRLEFCNLLMQPTDHVFVYRFNTSTASLQEPPEHDYTGHWPSNTLTIAIPGRIVFIKLVTDGSGTDHGFDVCNYHSF